MSVQEKYLETIMRQENLEYWKAVEQHPLGEVIPGLLEITSSQWKFWNKRPLIVQADMVMDGSTLMDLVREETQEKNHELERLYDDGDTSPLMVAMEAADEIVFLGIYVGMHPDNIVMWNEIGGEALAIARGAMQSLMEMRLLSGERRGGRDHERLLSDVPKFVAHAVIDDKNSSNYHEAYFAPAPKKYGNHCSSQTVTDAMIIDLYTHARSGARITRDAIKKQGLYTPYGIPNKLGMFATLNGRTPTI